jgi:hypothetical protein
MDPYYILTSNSDDCHPSSHLIFLRLFSHQRREAARLDAIAVSDGRDLEGGGGLKIKGRIQRSLGTRKQNEGA